ncbi:MAG TPA: glycosyltransferase family 2 protein [Rhizomicrobium sp.]|nr:glycosyltransferase family 2 protein [Rhizomicrobium sp.]
MLFSVVIPVFNRAAALGRALASVLAQSCGDFEIVVVDDGSLDDPRAVAQSFADPRIRVLRQDNRGGSAARNAGIDAARGRYVALLDSDDVFLPHHLETMAGLLAGTDGTVGFAPVLVDRGAGRMMVKPPRAPAAGEHMADYLLRDRGFVPTITLVLPRAIARAVRYDETLPFAQDTDFAIRLFLAGCTFAMAKAPGAVWHDGPNPNRVSAGRKGARLIPWLEAMRPRIPAKAYLGCRGWTVAKGLAAAAPRRALGCYLRALTAGCYRPKLALAVFLQIFVSDRLYRGLSDRAIALFHARAARP